MYLLFNPCTSILMLNQLTKQVNRDEGLRMNQPEKGGGGVRINTNIIHVLHNYTYCT